MKRLQVALKVFKFLFSRGFITFIGCVIQVAALCLILLYAHDWFALFQAVCITFAVIAFFEINNKKQQPEYKLSWTVLLFIFPILGLILYAFYYDPQLKRKKTRLMEKQYVEGVIYLPKTEIKEKENFSESFGISESLYRQMGFTGDFNNRATYLGSGEEFFLELKKELEKAENFIFMQFFIISPGKMWDEIHEILKRKVAAGVEVRVMYDDVGSLKMPISFAKKLIKDGIKCIKFNPMGPRAIGRYDNRDHRKIVIIDGKVAFTGGANIADEYINAIERFGKWKDSSIKIEGSEVKVFTFNFLLMFDALGKFKNPTTEFEQYLNIDAAKFTDEGYIQPFVDGPRPFYKDNISEENYINLISGAKNRLYITTPYLIPNYSILYALKLAVSRGVDVRIVTPHIPDKKAVFLITRSHYEFLCKSGVKVYEYTPGFIHSKQILSDDTAFIGTVNCDFRSFVHHFECGVNLYGTPCIKDIERDFENVFGESDIVDYKKINRNIFTKLITSIMNIFSPLL